MTRVGERRGQLDRTDVEILRILQMEGRKPNEEIGEKVHKSPSMVSRRIKRLIDDGYILRFEAVLNRKKLGLNYMISTLVSLEDHRPQTLKSFEEAVKDKFPNVIQWSRVQGSWDYLLVFFTRDQDHYRDLHWKLVSLPNVKRTRGHTPVDVSLPKPLPLPDVRTNRPDPEPQAER